MKMRFRKPAGLESRLRALKKRIKPEPELDPYTARLMEVVDIVYDCDDPQERKRRLERLPPLPEQPTTLLRMLQKAYGDRSDDAGEELQDRTDD
jgi:hypothetical protein